MHAKNRVFSETEVEQQSASMTIFRDVCDAELAPHARSECFEIRAFEVDLPCDARWIDQSREGLDQLGLAIAFNSCDADDFSATNFERHSFNTLRSRLIRD